MIQGMDHGGLDYVPAAFGTGRSLFRGPERALSAESIVAIGSTQTFGKFIAEPWPERLERSLGQQVVNLGSVNGGIDLYLNAPGLLDQIAKSRIVVMEIFSAAHLSNAFYTVHPMRNDRVVSVSASLCRLYPEVDFSEFAFIRHMMTHLQARDPHRFYRVARVLQQAWLDRMEQLLGRIGKPVIGLWLGDAPPPQRASHVGTDALFVTQAMVKRLRPRLAGLVSVTPGAQAREMQHPGRIFGALDRCAAETVFPAAVHQDVSNALVANVERICRQDAQTSLSA